MRSIRLRNSFHHIILRYAVWITLAPLAAAEAPRFIDVTPGNVYRADGSPLPVDLTGSGWKWKPEVGNGGVFESNPDIPGETMMVEVTGLEPNKAYEVFGFFWADGYGLDHPETRAQRAAQFGISLATLHTFDGPDQPVRGHVCAWQVTPGGTAGSSYGLKASIEEEHPLEGLGKLKLRHENARLVRARLGCLRADRAGKLPVYFADYPYRRPLGPAWIDGVAVRPLDVEGPLEEGWKKGTWLHLALRAGDSVTLERELQRGAEINLLDEEHLSPLLYAVASTDAALVKRLLDMGADPNLPTQAMTPLTAAVISSCEEIVGLLLAAGAEVPPELTPFSDSLPKSFHPGYAHPVVCAFRTGSVPILEMLLAKQPNLDMQKLMDMQRIEIKGRNPLTPPDKQALRNAIDAENWNFAAYLIDKGYADLGGYKPDGRLLVSCVAAGEPAMPVLERLLKLGIPPIDLEWRRGSVGDDHGNGRRHDGSSDIFRPVDVLSAAVWAGNVPLAKRFLPNVRYAPLEYLELLYITAAHAQNQEMAQVIKSELGNIRPLRWKPVSEAEQQETMSDEDLRVFLPRITAPPARADRQPGEYLLGVISSPNAAGPGAALTAAASTGKCWKAVDRELIEAALQESAFDKPWLKGQHQLSQLGDRLKADALAVVDEIKSDKDSLYSFELIEVATGLVFHREHLLASAFNPENDLAALLERTSRALDAAGGDSRRQAVTLLSFSTRGELPNGLALAKVLHATIQRQIDSTPGLISLTRTQSARLVEEQVLQGKNSIWGAAHLVEGSIFPADQPGMITVALRLETLGADRSSIKTDVEASGSIQDPQLVITTAWNNLFSKIHGLNGGNKPVARDNASSLPFAEQEAKRLLQEAKWLLAARTAPEKTAALIESATALGGPLDEIIHTQLDFMFRRVESLSCGKIGRPDSVESLYTGLAKLDHLPVALDLSDRMVGELPVARELLHQASYDFDFQTKELAAVKRRDNAFWLVINVLSYMRAAIYPDHLSENQRNDFIQFGKELDAFTKCYFDLLALEPSPDIGKIKLYCGDHHWILKRNPELYRGLVQGARRVNRIENILPHGIKKHVIGTQMARDILATLNGDTSRKAELFKAELRCYLGSAEDAPLLTRRFVTAALDHSRLEWYQLGNSDESAASMVPKYTPGYWLGGTQTASSKLPTLIHAPRTAPESMLKANVYLNTNYYRYGLPRPMGDRWFQIGSSEESYDRDMREAVTRKDPERLRNLFDAIHLHHLYSGHDHWPLLGKRYGGFLRQLTSPESAEPPVTTTTTLVSDFRNDTAPSPGSALWSMRDQEKPELLWVFYFSSASNSLGVNSGGWASDYSGKHDTSFRDVWLLGINCKTGKTEMKVNLYESALKTLGFARPAGKLESWDMVLDQNKNSIMMNLKVAAGRESRSRRDVNRIIVIDKADGKIRGLPEGYEIAPFTEGGTAACWVNVAGFGDDFYFIDESGHDRANSRDTKSSDKRAVSIYRVDRDLKMSPLVEHGRRPAITPFDAPDTIPHEIAVHDNRLLVFNVKQHCYFNPKENSWESIQDHHNKFGFKMVNFVQREVGRNMDPVHNIQANGVDTGWKIDFRKLKPDKLWCVHEEHGAVELDVKLDLPADFRATTTMVISERESIPQGSSSSQSVVLERPFDEYAAKYPPYLVVLNQTDDSLILGLQVGPAFHWRRPSRLGAHLPFLWKVSKKELLDRLAKAKNP